MATGMEPFVDHETYVHPSTKGSFTGKKARKNLPIARHSMYDY